MKFLLYFCFMYANQIKYKTIYDCLRIPLALSEHKKAAFYKKRHRNMGFLQRELIPSVDYFLPSVFMELSLRRKSFEALLSQRLIKYDRHRI